LRPPFLLRLGLCFPTEELLLWLQGLLLLPLLLLLLLWLALRVSAAALQQLLHAGSSIHPVVPHHESCMQQLPAQYPQLPREALIGSTAVRRPPCCVRLRCRRQAPAKWVSCVIHRWGSDMLQVLLLP
jgi:hypothetical protein